MSSGPLSRSLRDRSDTERASLVQEVYRYLTLAVVRGEMHDLNAAQAQDQICEHFDLCLKEWEELLPLLERYARRAE